MISGIENSTVYMAGEDLLKDTCLHIDELVRSENLEMLEKYCCCLLNMSNDLIDLIEPEKKQYARARLFIKLFPFLKRDERSKVMNFINESLDSLDFENESLIELRDYLEKTNKDKDFTNLSTSYFVFIKIGAMQLNRGTYTENFCKIKAHGFNLNLNFPLSSYRVDEFKQPIMDGIKVLKKSQD